MVTIGHHKNQLLDAGLDALITAFKKVIHKAVAATGKIIENKIADAVAKSNDDKIVKQKPVID